MVLVQLLCALGVGEELEVDRAQHIAEGAVLGGKAPTRHGDIRAGAARAAVVERGHGDGVGAADRLRHTGSSRERDVSQMWARCQLGAGVHVEVGGGAADGCQAKGRRPLYF